MADDTIDTSGPLNPDSGPYDALYAKYAEGTKAPLLLKQLEDKGVKAEDAEAMLLQSAHKALNMGIDHTKIGEGLGVSFKSADDARAYLRQGLGIESTGESGFGPAGMDAYDPIQAAKGLAVKGLAPANALLSHPTSTLDYLTQDKAARAAKGLGPLPSPVTDEDTAVARDIADGATLGNDPISTPEDRARLPFLNHLINSLPGMAVLGPMFGAGTEAVGGGLRGAAAVGGLAGEAQDANETTIQQKLINALMGAGVGGGVHMIGDFLGGLKRPNNDLTMFNRELPPSTGTPGGEPPASPAAFKVPSNVDPATLEARYPQPKTAAEPPIGPTSVNQEFPQPPEPRAAHPLKGSPLDWLVRTPDEGVKPLPFPPDAPETDLTHGQQRVAGQADTLKSKLDQMQSVWDSGDIPPQSEKVPSGQVLANPQGLGTAAIPQWAQDAVGGSRAPVPDQPPEGRIGSYEGGYDSTKGVVPQDAPEDAPTKPGLKSDSYLKGRTQGAIDAQDAEAVRKGQPPPLRGTSTGVKLNNDYLQSLPPAEVKPGEPGYVAPTPGPEGAVPAEAPDATVTKPGAGGMADHDQMAGVQEPGPKPAAAAAKSGSNEGTLYSTPIQKLWQLQDKALPKSIRDFVSSFVDRAKLPRMANARGGNAADVRANVTNSADNIAAFRRTASQFDGLVRSGFKKLVEFANSDAFANLPDDQKAASLEAKARVFNENATNQYLAEMRQAFPNLDKQTALSLVRSKLNMDATGSQALSRLMGMARTGQVLGNPFNYVGNVTFNGLMSGIHGSIWRVADPAVWGAGDIGNAISNEIDQSGLFERSFGRDANAQDVLRRLQRAGTPTGLVDMLTNWAEKGFNWSDYAFKRMAYAGERSKFISEKGLKPNAVLSPADASEVARRVFEFFPRWENTGMGGNNLSLLERGFVNPTFTWTTESARVLGNAAVQRPMTMLAGAYALRQMYTGALQHMAGSGIMPDQVEQERKKLASYQQMPAAFLIPIGEDGKGGVRFFDLGQHVPLFNLIAGNSWSAGKTIDQNLNDTLIHAGHQLFQHGVIQIEDPALAKEPSPLGDAASAAGQSWKDFAQNPSMQSFNGARAFTDNALKSARVGPINASSLMPGAVNAGLRIGQPTKWHPEGEPLKDFLRTIGFGTIDSGDLDEQIRGANDAKAQKRDLQQRAKTINNDPKYNADPKAKAILLNQLQAQMNALNKSRQ